MTDYQKLYNGISRAAWGYFFVYFDLNIEIVDILPDFVGYILFLYAINLLQEEERELSLLKPLGIIMTVWTVLVWLGSFRSMQIEGMWQFADIIICLVNLYFHFQLLTNMASIAAKHQSYGYELDVKLLHYRTVQTVMLTGIEIVTCLQPWLPNGMWLLASFCMLIAFVVACICIMRILFNLRKALPMNQI